METQTAERLQLNKSTGTQRVAILMMALGTENASRLMSMMSEKQVEQISIAIAKLKEVPPSLIRSVVSEFKALMMAKKFLLEGGVDMAREMLQNSLGDDKARDLIRRLEEATGSSAFAMFQKADIAQIVQILQNEHPQVASVILGHLKIDRAAEVLSHLQEGLRADISFRLATMKKMSPEVLEEIEKYLRERVEGITSEASLITGGPEFVAKVLNAASGSTEKGILEMLSERDPSLTEEIKKYMFLFEDILRIDDRTLQRIIKDLENKDLVLALKGSAEDLMEKFTNNMSTRAKDMLIEEIEMLGPVRVRDVEEAQQRIIQVIKQLEDSGEITLLINDDEGIIE